MLLFVSFALFSSTFSQSDQLKIVVHADQPGIAISKDLYGVFFEEINHSGDGGLNPELVRNFNFREPIFKSGETPGWKADGNRTLGKVTMGRDAVELVRPQAGEGVLGIENSGFWGIPFEKGEKYRFSIGCSSQTETPIRIRLLDQDGKVCGSATVTPTGQTSMLKGVITALESSPDARVEVSIPNVGQAYITSVSLTPINSWKGHGLRPDLASMVDGLHPAFVRFPGGCYVEGGDYLHDRFQWENTLGDPAGRRGHENATWGYWSSDGLGFNEYLQWCEDMGAEALFVVNCGFSHKETVPTDQLASYLASTMHALDYALGPATSQYGALRARLGHPAPFPLKYIEIGNENGQGWTSGGSPKDYAEHYKLFAETIKSAYPQLTLIADTRAASAAEMVDDHYYSSPSWFWSNTRLYDRTSRTGPKVYVGEYAVTQDCGHGNLKAALAEAAFLTGLERNSDLVRMASYAPLFVNVNNRAWNPDAICFDGEHSYGTPSYYTQQLFASNRGDVYLPTDYPDLPVSETWNGGIGLGTWNTSAEYKDISVTANGKNLYSSDFAGGSGNWKSLKGSWSVVDGAYRESDSGQDIKSILDMPMSDVGDCTIKLKARKISGDEGFLILFHAKDPSTYLWWNIGGWGNKENGVEAITPGGKYSVGRHAPFSVQTGKWYDLQIDVVGKEMQLRVDGKLVQTVRAAGAPTLAVSASRVEKGGDLILKVVNGAEEDRNASVNLDGVRDGSFEATATTLTSSSMADENSLAEPTKVAPKTGSLSVDHSTFNYNFPARSITILRLHRK